MTHQSGKIYGTGQKDAILFEPTDRRMLIIHAPSGQEPSSITTGSESTPKPFFKSTLTDTVESRTLQESLNNFQDLTKFKDLFDSL